MKKSLPFYQAALLLAFGFLFQVAVARADISFTINAADLMTHVPGTKLPAGSLLQIVDLGADGQFAPIVIDDGGSQWVSGDDRLLAVTFTMGGQSDQFLTTDAFDLLFGPDTEPGVLARTFDFAFGALTPGTKLGLRWFSGLTASGFNPNVGPVYGQMYGQFTRQDSALYGEDLWVVPQEGQAVNFDPLITLSAGGNDADALGVARFTVIPEPGSLGLLLGGVACMAIRRRR